MKTRKVHTISKLIPIFITILVINFVDAEGYINKVHYQTSEHELFSSEFFGSKLNVYSDVFPLVIKKNIKFSIKFLPLPDEKLIKLYNIRINLINTEDNSTIKDEFAKENDYYLWKRSFWSTGNYKFEIKVNYTDSNDNTFTSTFSFMQEVKEIQKEEASNNQDGMMGMNSTMLIVMGAMLIVGMAVMIISINHK